MKTNLGILFLAVALVTLQGCGASRTAGWALTAEKIELEPGEKARLVAEGKRLWQKRDDLESLTTALARFERVAAGDPDYEVLVLLCRGNYLLADAHLEDVEEKMKHWEMGSAWGEKALALNKEFRKFVVEEGHDLEEGLHLLDRKYVDAIYWSATNLGKWAKAKGVTSSVKYIPRIKKMITRVGELDSRYYYGAVDRYWGAYFAVLPGFFGGSLEKSLFHFQRSLKIENRYLGTHVLLAELYAPKMDDPDLFDKELQWVLKASSGSLADIVPEQKLEQRKAKVLLEKKGEIF